MAIEYRPTAVSPKSAPAREPKKSDPSVDKKSAAPKPEKPSIALSGKKVMFQQRIDSAVVDAFRSLDGNPAQNLTQAMIDYMEK